MDRLEFFQSVEMSNPYMDILTNFFDQFSILYNIIGVYGGVKISQTGNTLTNIDFSIYTISLDITNMIESRIQSYNIMNIYGGSYRVNSFRVNDTELHLSIDKIA